jgi:hypothetical protein
MHLRTAGVHDSDMELLRRSGVQSADQKAAVFFTDNYAGN